MKRRSLWTSNPHDVFVQRRQRELFRVLLRDDINRLRSVRVHVSRHRKRAYESGVGNRARNLNRAARPGDGSRA